MENENLLRREDTSSVVLSTGKGTQQGREESVERKMNTMLNTKTRQVFTCLTQGGFAFLPHEQPMPYAVENINRSIYISVHDSENMWVQDMPMNPLLYGCVTVLDDHEGRISVLPSNPEPCWIQTEDSAFNPKDLVSVKQGKDTMGYVVKVIETNTLCVASSEEETPGPSLEFLSATGYEWLKVQRGNPIPPNAVKTSVGFHGTSRYIGRTGGQTLRGIIATGGLVDLFTNHLGNRITSGEILVLTIDPKITSR